MCALQPGSGRPAQRGRRPQPVELARRRGAHHARLQGRVPPVRRRRLAGPAASGGLRRPGPAEDDRRGLHRDAQQREPQLCPVPAADRRRDRGAAHRRHARAAVALPAEDDCRRVDRHHEPDRAAGRLRPGAGAHPRRAATRRNLQALRHQDLHHLRRARHGRQYRPPRARSGGRCAAGREGHQPVHRAQIHDRFRRRAAGSQRRPLRQHRAQTRDQGQPDRGAPVRRPRGCGGHPGRPGEPRPRDHVHHDERRPLRGGRAGHRGRRARLPAGSPVREGPHPVASGRRLAAGQRADRPPPRRAPHADDDAFAGRGLPGDGHRRRRRLRRRAPPCRPRGAAREPGLLRIHGAADQGATAPR